MASKQKRHFVVGVTGGIGSGKTAVTNYLASLGVTIVDADIAARAIVEPGQPALDNIASHYGAGILLENGNLNRRKLREIIFDNPAEKQWLEQLLHPEINALLRQQLADATSPYVVLVSPLLTETGQHTLCDHILVIDTPEHVQVDRTVARDSTTEEQALKIINSQIQREKRLSFADTIVDNSGSLSELHDTLEQFHNDMITALFNKGSDH
ncbi:dephospho-CoA kinase [Candidatus Sororendozoicomonas aggregata]|uniref:dephospho-CoA kinase n=1 Tax=Candidatus Sororendozoicomonas aggregata TaxID=3073239 RepID=UPI002ED60F24